MPARSTSDMKHNDMHLILLHLGAAISSENDALNEHFPHPVFTTGNISQKDCGTPVTHSWLCTTSPTQ